MEMLCVRNDGTCRAHALAAALHSLNLYCAAIFTAFLCCSSPPRTYWSGVRWRYQNIRGIASIAVGVIWCCGAAAASLRPSDTMRLIAGLIAPLAWLAAAAMHVALWTRRSTATILYLAIYWLLSCVSSSFIIYSFLDAGVPLDHVEIYVHGVGMLLALLISGVDWLCFYDKVTKERFTQKKTSIDNKELTYLYNDTHFYSKITFFWLNPLLYKVYYSLVEKENFGDLPESETSKLQYEKFQKYYKHKVQTGKEVSLWRCYTRVVWPNFYIAGVLKFLSDLTSVIPALGLAVIIQFIDDPILSYDIQSEVTISELLSNGYTMLLIVTMALIIQALLSQNSTHLVTVEGTRLKIALQSMIYDKCTRLAFSSIALEVNEQAPLLHNPEEANTQSGLIMNLLSQDTYNIMSFAWIFHYMWAIPLKIIVILYLLYRKLGMSPIIGVAVSFWIIIPLQLYIGKKISDNSKDISKCSDHRVTKISEILQGITVIKLYVWENLFNEKILQFREVELKLLNKDSAYWAFLTFTTQISAVLITVITFTLHYYVENTISLNAINVFAGLALFNQLTIPLLILPVTILMTIQAMVSTKRIKDFMDLPESNNAQNDIEDSYFDKMSNNLNDASLVTNLKNHTIAEHDEFNIDEGAQDGKEDDVNEDFKTTYNIAQAQEYLIRFKNAAFSWRVNENAWIEIDELNIPAGKLIMVVGTSSSGKSSLLSSILGEMNQTRGDVYRSRQCSMWYAGQPPWILEESIKDNILMGSTFCAQNYSRVIRATGLKPDLQILPDGDNTNLGSHGTPLSGGQRVRLCIARAIYSSAKLIILDEPFGALDSILARHVVTRALLPATRAGRTVVLATNRLELLHYADMIIAMEDGRVSGIGGLNSFCEGPLGQWAQLAMEAREVVGRTGAGPPGGCARERLQLLRSISRRQFQREISTDTLQIDINEVVGARFLAEIPTCTGSLRLASKQNMSLSFTRQFSSPPSSEQRSKWPREVRRTMSADPTIEILHHDSNLLRRQLRRPFLTLSRWTPKSLRRLLSSDSESPTNEIQKNNGHPTGQSSDVTFTSTTSNGNETFVTPIKDSTSTSKEQMEPVSSKSSIWWTYARACGWWGAMYWVAAAVAQAIALAADYWLSLIAAENEQRSLSDEQIWNKISLYALWGVSGMCAAGCAQVVCACAGAASRRILHERLLHATLHAPIYYHNTHQAGETLHRFSSDMLVVDKKLPIATSRWAQLSLLCGTAILVNIIASPWTLLAMIPAFTSYVVLLSIYLRNARELQQIEADSAAHTVSFASQTFVGAVTIRAGRVRTQMCESFYRHLDRNHNALLLLNSANRWLSLSLDLVGAACVTVSLAAALYSDGSGVVTGLAGTYSLLLPVYLSHLAKGRAELDVQLASVKRIHTDTNILQEDYRDESPIPPQWKRNGKIEFQDVSILHAPDTVPVLKNINLSIKPGQKVAICGRSGSGKSTLLLTCAGATTIHSGRLLLDGQDITRVPLRALRHRVVVLPQEVIMFSGTLRENLDPLAVHTDEEIWKCVSAVGLQDFVNAQPAGLECSVNIWRGGWGGSRGSRVCVARAALHAKLAAALLLDEPGASLDAFTERTLLHAISTVAPNTTIITVAHRVSSIRAYDSVVVLEDGVVVERGDLDAILQEPTSRLARLSQALVTQHNHL